MLQKFFCKYLSVILFLLVIYCLYCKLYGTFIVMNTHPCICMHVCVCVCDCVSVLVTALAGRDASLQVRKELPKGFGPHCITMQLRFT